MAGSHGPVAGSVRRWIVWMPIRRRLSSGKAAMLSCPTCQTRRSWRADYGTVNNGGLPMKITHVAAVALLLAGTSHAQQPQQEAPPPVPPGARHVPDHIVPVPDTVSP